MGGRVDPQVDKKLASEEALRIWESAIAETAA